jgi:endonuclease/exonuclease/phosphatase family metal-dependent hydrolase
MKVSLLTYNLLFNNALSTISDVLVTCKPDIVCLQEIETAEDNLKQVEKYGYKLADFSNSFIKYGKVYGLATFYRPQTFNFVTSTSLTLPRSYYEFFLDLLRGGNNPRTVLKTTFSFKKSQKKLINYNMHLTAKGANGIRVRQIQTTLDDLRIDKHPLLIAGDFNYPYQRKQFEVLIEQYGLREATHTVYSTFESNFLKLLPVTFKLDYILYKNLKLISTDKISSRESDHFPILSTFEVL